MRTNILTLIFFNTLCQLYLYMYKVVDKESNAHNNASQVLLKLSVIKIVDIVLDLRIERSEVLLSSVK